MVLNSSIGIPAELTFIQKAGIFFELKIILKNLSFLSDFYTGHVKESVFGKFWR